jgi:fatty acid kinase fatty acid binding subunit
VYFTVDLVERYRTRGKPKLQPHPHMEVALTATTPVAIVTDSAAGLPAAFLERYNIAVVPYWVHMGHESYLSGETMAPPEFFSRMRAAPEMEVHTGVPAIARLIEIYQDLATKAQGIVSIHVAGKQSGTCNAAELAAKESPVPVVVLDTETTAMAEGFTVLAAARAAKEGNSLENVVARARAVIPNTGVIALLESVTYALKGGRLSAAAGRVGSMLRIHPLVRVKDNKVSLVGQVRRRSKGIEALIERAVDEIHGDPAHLTVHFAEDEAEGQHLLDILKSRINCVESYLMRVPVELGVHAGPGSIGLAYHIERESIGLVQKLERLGTQAKDAIRSRLP